MRALAIAAMVATGCGSSSTYRTTRIATPGHTEWLFGAQVSGAGTMGASENGEVQNKVAPLPELAIGARRGLDDRFEVQLNGTMLPLKQANTGSLELAGKMRLAEHGRWSLAAGVAGSYRIAQAGGALIEGVTVSAPLIGAVELGRHQLVLSVSGGYQRWYSSGARPVEVPFVGESLGFLWQVSKNVALLPEVGTAWSPTPNFMTQDTKLFHAGFAVLWTR
jgi:hypothetical protein